MSGTLGVAVFALAAAVTTSVQAATFTHYGPPNAGPWSLSGHSVAGGSGTLPNEYRARSRGTSPRRLLHRVQVRSAAGADDERAAPDGERHQSRQPDRLRPGDSREPYQLRHNAQADSSACQAKGATWGFWTNAATNNNYCSNWCGVRHDYSTGQAIGTRPWSNGFPPARSS